MIQLARLFTPKFFRGLLFAVVLLAVLLAVGGTIFAGYQYATGLQDENTRLTTENATLEGNNVQLEQAIVEQQNTIASLERDIQLQAEIFNETNEQFERARNQVDSLRERLGEHELSSLALARPGLVERVINNATDSVGRCFEIAAGAPLTDAELNATLPSQINRECPDLANPNYGGD